MNKFTIFHRNIKFVLKHNGKSLMNKPIFDSLEDNLYYIFGKELKDNLLEINGSLKGLKVVGFLAKPSSISYGVKKNQHIFVNSRFVKSRLINKAMYEGFGTNLMEGRHPFFVIFIDIDPEIIDVNVHPTKIEIKFENELEIYDFICDSIRQVFEKNTSFKEFESKKKEIDISLDKSCGVDIGSPTFKREVKNKYYSVDVQKDLSEIKEDVEVFDSVALKGEVTSNLETFTTLDVEVDTDIQSVQYGPLYDELKEYKIIGQINKTFIIIETPVEMIMIDQHVAEEKFFMRVLNSNMNKQNLKFKNC